MSILTKLQGIKNPSTSSVPDSRPALVEKREPRKEIEI